MKSVKCYACGISLHQFVDIWFKTVIPSATIYGGKEILCEDCAKEVFSGSSQEQVVPDSSQEV